MKQKSWQFWGLVAGLYLFLMSPFVGLAVVGLINRDPTASLASFVVIAAFVVWFPLYVALAIVLTWNMAPLVYWIAWQFLQAIEWITGLQVGTRFGERIVASAYFKHSKPGWPAQWLYRRVLAQSGDLQPPPEKPTTNA
jgi:hypothetical protein